MKSTAFAEVETVLRRLISACALILIAGGVSAGETAWQRTHGASLRLIYAPSDSNEGDILAGVQVRPDRGYKLFWRSPGAFGLAPSFDFASSSNLGAANVLWPVPRRLSIDGVMSSSIGYDRETVFPIEVKPARALEPVGLRVVFDYAVCGDVCIPGRTEFSLSLSAHEPAKDETAELVRRFRARVPTTAPGTVRARKQEDAVIVETEHEAGFSAPDVFVDAGRERHFARPSHTLSSDKRTARFRIPLDGTAPEALPSRIAVVLVDGTSGYEAEVDLSD